MKTLNGLFKFTSVLLISALLFSCSRTAPPPSRLKENLAQGTATLAHWKGAPYTDKIEFAEQLTLEHLGKVDELKAEKLKKEIDRSIGKIVKSTINNPEAQESALNIDLNDQAKAIIRILGWQK